MQAEALLRAGHVDEALKELQAAVRASSADGRLRLFLAQLLMVQGAWQRALGQLQVAAQLLPESVPMAHAYRLLIVAEMTRSAVFAGDSTPAVLGEPEAWLARLIDAVGALGRGQRGASIMQTVASALEEAQTVPGTIDGKPFEWLGDVDMRLGPVFEIVMNGRYFWVPGQHIRRLTLEAPTDLRDLVWLPASVEWVNGGTAEVFIPVRYPKSEQAADAFRLARNTEFDEPIGGLWTATGQRMFATDHGEYPMLETRSIEFEQVSV